MPSLGPSTAMKGEVCNCSRRARRAAPGSSGTLFSSSFNNPDVHYFRKNNYPPVSTPFPAPNSYNTFFNNPNSPKKHAPHIVVALSLPHSLSHSLNSTRLNSTQLTRSHFAALRDLTHELGLVVRPRRAGILHNRLSLIGSTMINTTITQ